MSASNADWSARAVAARVIVRVEKDRAYAAAALDAEIERAAQMSARDRALATELAYGTLRVMPWLYARIDRHAKKSVTKLDPRVRAPMVLAAYQLYFMRIAAFAAVNEAVDAVRAANGPRVGAFANAVLRKVARDAEVERAGDEKLTEDAIVESAAPWLRDALTRALGAEDARAFLVSGRGAPPIGMRIEDEDRDGWLARMREASPGASFELGKVSPRAILVRGAGRVQALPGFAEGSWTIQEEGSQLIALALGVKTGESVLDACAGRGNKTSLFARAVSDRGAVDAADLHPSKLDRLRAELTRLHLAPRSTYAVDWTMGSGEIEGTYDRVIVDAPCSGVGTLRRRPDLQTRRVAEDLASLRETQLAIAQRASTLVKSGGAFVYAVCSVLREEAEEVVEKLLATTPELVPARFPGEPARILAGELSSLRLLPHVHGTDGYFLASFTKH